MVSVWFFFFFSSRRRHTRFSRDWSSDVCSSDLGWLAHRTGVPRDDLPIGDPARRGVLCESVLHIAAQWVDVDALHRAPVSFVVLVHPTTPARLAQIGPVGGLVTGRPPV